MPESLKFELAEISSYNYRLHQKVHQSFDLAQVLHNLTASIITPAELGESHTYNLYSRVRGTSPKALPSRRT